MQLYQALITLDGWTFLAQVCNLMIQLVIFKKLLLHPVKSHRRAQGQGGQPDRGRRKAAHRG